MSDIGGDVFDIRDAMKRFEELEEIEERDADEETEFTTLQTLLEDTKGYGGDEQWRGDWYPVTFIRDDYFEQHARDLADDLGLIKDDASWPYTCIDWERAARELQQDYSSVEVDGVTYWYR